MDQQKLVRECLKGDPAAQHQLYDLFAGKMLAVCYRYTKSMADAEDILQEGFVKVYKNLGQFKFQGDLGAWIRRIMVNSAINFLKQHSRYKHELFYTESTLHPVSTEDVESSIQAKELAELIRQLPPGYQIIFNLHAVEGFTHVEIGKILGINEGTSRSQYARSRALLISWLNNLSKEAKMEKYARP